MNLPIYQYGHPVLRNISEQVGADYPDLKTLVANMYETMYHSEGVGLAAPQVGLNIRLVVIDADAVGESFPECVGRRFTLVNPNIKMLSDETVTRSEGCLSLPGLSENVPRVEHIQLDWLDEDMQPHSEILTGFMARIVQHECDHLDGKLYIDHISPIRKQLIKGKLSQIMQGRINVDYPVRIAPRKRK